MQSGCSGESSRIRVILDYAQINLNSQNKARKDGTSTAENQITQCTEDTGLLAANELVGYKPVSGCL